MNHFPVTGEVTEAGGPFEKMVVGGSGLCWADPDPASGQLLWFRSKDGEFQRELIRCVHTAQGWG